MQSIFLAWLLVLRIFLVWFADHTIKYNDIIQNSRILIPEYYMHSFNQLQGIISYNNPYLNGGLDGPLDFSPYCQPHVHLYKHSCIIMTSLHYVETRSFESKGLSKNNLKTGTLVVVRIDVWNLYRALPEWADSDTWNDFTSFDSHMPYFQFTVTGYYLIFPGLNWTTKFR